MSMIPIPSGTIRTLLQHCLMLTVAIGTCIVPISSSAQGMFTRREEAAFGGMVSFRSNHSLGKGGEATVGATVSGAVDPSATIGILNSNHDVSVTAIGVGVEVHLTKLITQSPINASVLLGYEFDQYSSSKSANSLTADSYLIGTNIYATIPVDARHRVVPRIGYGVAWSQPSTSRERVSFRRYLADLSVLFDLKSTESIILQSGVLVDDGYAWVRIGLGIVSRIV